MFQQHSLEEVSMYDTTIDNFKGSWHKPSLNLLFVINKVHLVKAPFSGF